MSLGTIYIRMSADSFQKIKTAAEEVIQKRPVQPVHELSKEIYNIFPRNDVYAYLEFCDDYTEFITENHFISRDGEYVDFMFDPVHLFNNKPPQIFEFLHLALKQDNNYDLVIINKDGSILKEEYNSGTFLGSPLCESVNTARAMLIYYNAAFLVADNQLRTGSDDSSAFTKTSTEYLKLVNEFRKIQKEFPEYNLDKHTCEFLKRKAQSKARQSICSQNNLPDNLSFEQVKGLMASRRNEQHNKEAAR